MDNCSDNFWAYISYKPENPSVSFIMHSKQFFKITSFLIASLSAGLRILRPPNQPLTSFVNCMYRSLHTLAK